MLFGTLAVSADAHAGIQSASGKSGVPTAIAENESGAVTSAKASVGKSRKAKASANTVADSGLYQVKIAGDICPSAGSRAMDLINQYRDANGKSRIVWNNTYEKMAITRAGEISVYYNAMRPSGMAGPDFIIGFYDEDSGATIDTWFNKLDPDKKNYFWRISGSPDGLASSAAKPDIAMLPWTCTRRQRREARTPTIRKGNTCGPSM